MQLRMNNRSHYVRNRWNAVCLAFRIVALVALTVQPVVCMGQTTASPGLAISPGSSSDSVKSNDAGKLRLTSGDVYSGHLHSVRSGEGVLWQCDGFKGPITFPWSMIESLEQTNAANAAASNGSGATSVAGANGNSDNPMFCFELVNGNSLTGFVAGVDSESISVVSPYWDARKIPQSQLLSMFRVEQSDATSNSTVLAPEKWVQETPAFRNGKGRKWFPKLGSIGTDTAGASISQKVFMQNNASIDLHVTWEQANPGWWFTIGEPTGLDLQVRKVSSKKQLKITLAIENDDEGDVATVLIPDDDSKSISLRILCDSRAGRYILEYRGDVIADLRIKNASRLVGVQPFTFKNSSVGAITLREVVVGRNNFSMPISNSASEGKPLVLVSGNPSVAATPVEFNAEAKSIGFRGDGSDVSPIPLSAIQRIEFPNQKLAADTTATQPTQPADAVSPDNTTSANGTVAVQTKRRSAVIELFSGERVSGASVRSDGDMVAIEFNGAGGELRFPPAAIRRVWQSGTGVKVAEPVAQDAETPAVQEFRLVTANIMSTGRLTGVSANDEGQKSTLLWHPRGAAGAVAINDTINGFIEPLGSTGKARTGTRKPDGEPLAGANIRSSEPTYGRPLRNYEPSLFLKNGDCFPAAIELCNEESVLFKSSMFTSGQIESSLVRGIRVLAYSGSDAMAKETRKRVMTLPRMQRNNPPTHVVLSREGDLIRGRLIRMTVDELTMDVRGVEKTVLMKNIAEIIWLQPSDPVPSREAKGNATAPAANATPTTPDTVAPLLGYYQVHLESGTRVTLSPVSSNDTHLAGKHPQLGECQLEWAKIARLSLGNDISADSGNRFSKWKLQNAIDPMFMNESDDEGGSGEMEAGDLALSGKPAPEFELKTLDGNGIKLSELKGKVVILDFWATWCGPCVVALPKIVRLADEYKPAPLQLVAVNLEQSEAEISKFLTRTKIDPKVALDTDGAVSRLYHVDAIPKTIVIDQDGIVRAVIVGGGEEAEDRLRNALDKLLNLKL